MWFTREGEGYLVSMDNAPRLFSPSLRDALLALDERRRRDLVTEFRPYFQQLWDQMERFAPESDEEKYVEMDPPSEYHLDVVGSPTAANIAAALNAVPLRWRVDLAMALMLYLEVDLESSST